MLFVTVVAIYSISIVDLGSSDPKLVPLTARSIVYEHDLDLDEYPSTQLLRHPITITGDVPDRLLVFDDTDQLDRARSAPGARLYDFFPWSAALPAVVVVVAVDAKAAILGGPDTAELSEQQNLTRYLLITASMVVAGAVLVVRAIALLLVDGGHLRRRSVATLTALAFAFGTSAWSTASRAPSRNPRHSVCATARSSPPSSGTAVWATGA